jgi:triosephosphate isomerase
MESKKMVVGNHKMSMTLEDVSVYLKKINNITSSNVVICPTSIYIPYFLKHKYQVGIQNTAFTSEGAYTGEISPKQAASMHIKYTILGHSERRISFKESDLDINKKIHEAIKYNMKVIFCIGETSEERNLLKTDQVLKRQLVNGLKDIDETMYDNIIIAYEPVWAIGTNITPTNKEIKDAVDYIKMIINKILGENQIRVLYGGSVNEKNIKELNKIDNLSGFLVGGASTDAEKFLKIVEEVVGIQ